MEARGDGRGGDPATHIAENRAHDRPKVDRQHYLDNVKKLGVRGRIVAVDRKRDLALIEIDRIPEGAKPVLLAANSALPGDAVNSVGNPGSTEALWVFTSGTVRSVYKKQFRTGVGEHEFTVVETQAPITSRCSSSRPT